MPSNPTTVPRNRGFDTLFFRNRHLLVLAIAIICVAGLSALINLPRIEDPRITNRNPTIVTLLPGASAARVEALVNKKLEDALRQLPEIKEIETTARPGVSLIKVELQDDIGKGSNETVFSKIRDKLADAGRELPPGATRPEFDDKRGAVAFSMIVALQWRTGGAPQLGILNRYAEELADRLRNLPGSDTVRLYGEPVEQITVTADPGELAALGLSIRRVSELLASADAKTPAGVLRSGERDLLIEVEGELNSLERVAAVPLGANTAGGIIKLGDIAQITRSWQEPPANLAFSRGVRAILVAARVEEDVRVDTWAESARAVVASLDAEVGGGIGFELVFDQSRYVTERLGSLAGNLLAGALVVIAVVLLGMGWRAALIVGSALPLSVACTVFGLTFFGQQIHQMTIFGLIIAIGLLIDNAIVMTDEVRKELRAGRTPVAAVSASVRHLFTPLLASSLTTILGFMPIFLLPGNVGDFVGPLAVSVVLALVASFFISMTIVPALAARFAAPSRPDQPKCWWRDGLASERVTRIYRHGLLAVVQRPIAAVSASLVLPVLGLALAGTLGKQFFPPAERDQFEVEVWLSGDASLERTADYAARIEEIIRRQPTVRRVDWLIGGSYPSVYYNLVMNKDNKPSYAHGIVLTDGVEAAAELISALQNAFDEGFPDAQVVVSPFGQGPPYEAPIAFRIVGPSMSQLKAYGEELRRILHTLPEILHTQASIAGGEPKLWVEADENEARLAGLTLSDMASQLQSNLEGRIGGSVLEDLEELPVRIRYDQAQRSSLANISSLGLVSRAAAQVGGWVPVASLGDVRLKPEPGTITRRNDERVNKVLGYVTRGTLPIDVNQAILSRLEAQGFELAPGYRLEVAGDSEEQSRAIGALLTYLPVLGVLMIATLVLSFRSFALSGVVGAVAVMSVGLGMLSLWLSGYPLGFNPLLGSAGLVGVAINGTIVVLAAIRANAQAGAGDPAMIVEETVGATRHILSTTLTTMGGFLPFLVLTGGEFWPPLAVVIAGGVGFSVILSLVFTPAMYYLLERRRRARASRELPTIDIDLERTHITGP